MGTIMPEEFFSSEAHATHSNFTKSDGLGPGLVDCAAVHVAQRIDADTSPVSSGVIRTFCPR